MGALEYRMAPCMICIAWDSGYVEEQIFVPQGAQRATVES